MKSKLNIIEPWEHGTEKSIDVDIIGKNNNQYFLKLNTPISIKDYEYHYLLFRLKGEEKSIDITEAKGVFPIEIVYKEELREDNFSTYQIDDFRSNFLLGEIVL